MCFVQQKKNYMRNSKHKANQSHEKCIAPVEVIERLITADNVRATRWRNIARILAWSNITTALQLNVL
jgi:hypothetical protein